VWELLHNLNTHKITRGVRKDNPTHRSSSVHSVYTLYCGNKYVCSNINSTPSYSDVPDTPTYSVEVFCTRMWFSIVVRTHTLSRTQWSHRSRTQTVLDQLQHDSYSNEEYT